MSAAGSWQVGVVPLDDGVFGTTLNETRIDYVFVERVTLSR